MLNKLVEVAGRRKRKKAALLLGAPLSERLNPRGYLPATSKLTFASSFAFTVTFWVFLPSFSCQTSIV